MGHDVKIACNSATLFMNLQVSTGSIASTNWWAQKYPSENKILDLPPPTSMHRHKGKSRRTRGKYMCDAFMCVSALAHACIRTRECVRLRVCVCLFSSPTCPSATADAACSSRLPSDKPSSSMRPTGLELPLCTSANHVHNKSIQRRVTWACKAKGCPHMQPGSWMV